MNLDSTAGGRRSSPPSPSPGRFSRLFGSRSRRKALPIAASILGAVLVAGVSGAETFVTVLRPGDQLDVVCEDGTKLRWDRTSDLAGTLECRGTTTTTTAPESTTTTTTAPAPTTTTTTAPSNDEEPAPAPGSDPTDCSGYPEWRTFLEAQSWWVDSENPFPGQHVHLATCFPLHQTVSGTVHFDIRVMAHNVPGTITRIAVEAFGNGEIQRKDVNLACSVMDCMWVVPFDFDTTKTDYNGRWEFRMRAIVSESPNGSKQYNSTRWHATIDNPGKPWKDGSESTSRSPGGAGWYTGIGYMNVFCGDGGYDLVRGPVSGVVTLSCRFDQETAFASVDGNFHAMPPNPGTVLLDSSSGGWKTITIDTTKFANGKHRLFMRTDAHGSSPAGIGSGALAMVFDVQN